MSLESPGDQLRKRDYSQLSVSPLAPGSAKLKQKEPRYMLRCPTMSHMDPDWFLIVFAITRQPASFNNTQHDMHVCMCFSHLHFDAH